MNIIKNLSLLIVALLAVTSCTNSETKESPKEDEVCIKYSIVGKQINVSYPEMNAEISYLTDSTLHWKTIASDNIAYEGDEKMNYQQVGDSLFFINWIEQDGETVSQVVDFKNKKVVVFLSMHDDNSDRGKRSSLFFEGKINTIN